MHVWPSGVGNRYRDIILSIGKLLRATPTAGQRAAPAVSPSCKHHHDSFLFSAHSQSCIMSCYSVARFSQGWCLGEGVVRDLLFLGCQLCRPPCCGCVRLSSPLLTQPPLSNSRVLEHTCLAMCEGQGLTHEG